MNLKDVPAGPEAGMILIVEDDPAIAELERRSLEGAGYAVLTATTAEDAAAKVAGDGVALVVVDHVLPGGVSGVTLYERLKEAGYDLPVVMVAQQGDEETVTRAMRAGVRHYAVKFPEHLGFLPEVVGRALSQARTERLLEESEERFRALTEAAFEAVVIVEDGRILEANRACAEMFGYETSEIVGGPVWKIVAPESVDLVRGSMSSGRGEPYEAVGLRRDGTRLPLPVPVDALLDDAARFARTLPGGHDLVVEGAPDGREVWADQYRIGQVLRNLLSNAAKYSPDGAPIRLRVAPGGVPEGPGDDPGRVRIEVVDRGPGVHPDDAGRIFEKFGRGRGREGRQVTGLGLGLYLSRRILQAHGGDLTLDPAPGGGSVFGFGLRAAG